ncbi:MAG: hypothetical protein IPJ24_04085 [bacterium]|nr:hypothetical protein [bacterium]
MQAPKAFVKDVLWAEGAALFGLFATGLALTMAENRRHGGGSFFTYRIEHLDHVPAWFAAALMLAAINGFWMFRLASIEGVFHTPHGSGWGEWGASVPINPLRLFAINLVAVPVAMALFIVARANGW